MKTIMIVDDEKSVLDQVRSSLDENEYDIVTVKNNREAIEMIENDKHDRFGLILIDTSLPDSKQPALFSMKPQSKKNIDTSRKEDFLLKPFTKEQLIDFINKNFTH
jgi:DNA-binding NtrC family response regulator